MSDVPNEVEVAKASLAAAITYNATEATVLGDVDDWPESDFEIKIENEVIAVGSRSGNVLSSLTRAPYGEGRSPHPFSADVLRVLTGEQLAEGGTGEGGGGGAIYGDGSDGAHVCVDGEQLESGFYTDFTIPDGITVTVPRNIVNPVFIFCTGTYTIDGTIDMSGVDAVDRHGAGGGSTSGQPFSGLDGGQTDGIPSTYGGQVGNLGGRAGRGASGNTSPTLFLAPSILYRNGLHLIALANYTYPGGGGAGGGGDGTNYGGGGGSGGQSFVVCARHVVHGPDNQYLVQGGDGAPGGDDGSGTTGNGTCGGGGGGAAGWWMTISDTIEGADAAIVGTGGAGGPACGDSSSAATIISSGPVTFPLTITTGVNDQFVWDGAPSLMFAITPGTYASVGDLIPAIRDAVLTTDHSRTWDTILGTDGPDGQGWTIYDQSGTEVAFSSPTDGGGSQYNGTTINDGTHSALGDLNFTDDQEASGGTDGSEDGLPGSDGFVIHLLNAA